MNYIFSMIKFTYQCPNCKTRISVSYPDIVCESNTVQNKLENRVCEKCNQRFVMFPIKVECDINTSARKVELHMVCKSCGSIWREYKILHDKYTAAMARRDISAESCINPQCDGQEIILKSTVY